MENDTQQIMIRYLLDQMSDGERTAFEESYFADRSVFDQLLSAENDLIDNYVAGRLAGDTISRFERIYILDEAKRERVRFAESLAMKIAQKPDKGLSDAQTAEKIPMWNSFAKLFGSRRPLIQFTVAFTAFVLVVGGIWLLSMAGVEQREDIAKVIPQGEPATVVPPPDANETPQVPVSDIRPETRQPSPQPRPTPAAFEPSPVTLALNVGGLRSDSSVSTPSLTIPGGTREVRLKLRLTENAYRQYYYSINTADGSNVIERTSIRAARVGTGAAFVVRVPASSLSNGDYILTLSGAGSDTVDDISRSLFRVRKK